MDKVGTRDEKTKDLYIVKYALEISYLGYKLKMEENENEKATIENEIKYYLHRINDIVKEGKYGQR